MHSGKPLSSKSLRHQYVTLNVIFGYAVQQEMLVKNPMEKGTTPKKDKNPVDALTKEQAARLLALLPTLPLDFHCMMNLLVTSGIRRGECIGLKWCDLDEKSCTIKISRNVVYDLRGGVTVSPQDNP